MNWKLTLSYDGTTFHGWQVQPGLPTVQGALAAAIAQVTGETVLPQGSGRTDSGVHALMQVASFSLEAPVPAANLLRALNRVLPASVRVLAATAIDRGFHARHSVRGKLYEYRIFERRTTRSTPGEAALARICSPFLAPYVWDCRWLLDFEAMQQGAAALAGTHDFTSFAASDPDKALRDEDGAAELDETGRRMKVNPVKTIQSSVWTREDGLLIYRVRGSGFLHHMVRNIVGTLVDIGRGSLFASDIPVILDARDRTRAGPTAPARGLFLHTVEYDPRYADDAGPVGADDAGSEQ
ncbi:MAG TPA: tRNA pseudouridine(38-40) synthase TruA [Acidobacteriaceae bacterium]|jgi:tRNA pseudouridine38-40 synthase